MYDSLHLIHPQLVRMLVALVTCVVRALLSCMPPTFFNIFIIFVGRFSIFVGDSNCSSYVIRSWFNTLMWAHCLWCSGYCGLIIIGITIITHSSVVVIHHFIHVYQSIIIMITVHDNVREAMEFIPAKWLGEEVTDHHIGEAVHNDDMSLFLHIGHEKIPNVHVSCLLAAWSLSIHFQRHHALIVLMHNVRLYWVTLFLEKAVHPQNLWHFVMHCNCFGLSETCCVDFLLVWGAAHCAPAKCHVWSRIASHVIMNCKSPINKPVILIKVSCFHCEAYEFFPPDAFNHSCELLAAIPIRGLHPCAKKQNCCLYIWPSPFACKQQLLCHSMTQFCLLIDEFDCIIPGFKMMFGCWKCGCSVHVLREALEHLV